MNAGELFLNVFTGRFMIWGRTQALTAGGRKEGSLCGCLTCCKSMLARGSLGFDGAELGQLELGPPGSQKLPQDRPSPNWDAANWKQMVLEGWAPGLRWLVGTHTHTHKYIVTHIVTHPNTLMHTNTNTHLQPAISHTVNTQEFHNP